MNEDRLHFKSNWLKAPRFPWKYILKHIIPHSWLFDLYCRSEILSGKHECRLVILTGDISWLAWRPLRFWKPLSYSSCVNLGLSCKYSCTPKLHQICQSALWVSECSVVIPCTHYHVRISKGLMVCLLVLSRTPWRNTPLYILINPPLVLIILVGICVHHLLVTQHLRLNESMLNLLQGHVRKVLEFKELVYSPCIFGFLSSWFSQRQKLKFHWLGANHHPGSSGKLPRKRRSWFISENINVNDREGS